MASRRELYKIRINLIDQNNNEFIIDNMNNILLEDFSDKESFDYFKENYTQLNIPLYIYKEPYYINDNVLRSIKEETRPKNKKFPKYSTNPERKKFISEKIINYNGKNNEEAKEILYEIIKREIIKIHKNKPNKENINFDNIKNIFDLFKNNIILDEYISKLSTSNILEDIYNNPKDDTEKKFKEYINLIFNTSSNPLANKESYEYFLNKEYITAIFDHVINNSKISPTDYGYGYGYGRPTLLNSDSEKENIYKKFIKYIFPTKKNIQQLNEREKNEILMFNNIFYILKNIYLTNNTIIVLKKEKNGKFFEDKYYISDLNLLDTKSYNLHFKKTPDTIDIYLKINLKYIFENPILKINYLIDDIEDLEQRFPSITYNIEPKDINNEFNKYNNIYIHNKIKYSSINLDNFFQRLDVKKIIKNKEEIFFNTNILFKFEKTFGSQYQNSENQDIIESNIKYILFNIFKLYNSKPFKNYYIDDTLIKFLKEEKEETKKNIKFYSIFEKRIIDKNSKKDIRIDNTFSSAQSAITSAQSGIKTTDEAAIKVIRGQRVTKQFKKLLSKIKLYIEQPPEDARLSNNIIYNIYIVLKAYKSGANKEKPDFKRKFIAEQCLQRAEVLDTAFTSSLYNFFGLPHNFLYSKLSNLKNSQPIKTLQIDDKKVVEKPDKINDIKQQEKIKLQPPKGGENTKKNINNNKKTRKH